jgi:hypothetical protein
MRSRPGLSVVDEVQDDSGFRLGVGDPVVWPDLCGFQLDHGVGVPGIRVAAEIVAKQQVLTFPLGSGLANVHMHVPRLAREWAEEAMQGIAAAQLDSGLFDLGHVLGLIIQVGHADLDVDGGLRRQAGNGRGADVFDSQRHIPEFTVQAAAPLFVAPWPGGVIGDHLDVPVLSPAPLGPAESRPDGWVNARSE